MSAKDDLKERITNNLEVAYNALSLVKKDMNLLELAGGNNIDSDKTWSTLISIRQSLQMFILNQKSTNLKIKN